MGHKPLFQLLGELNGKVVRYHIRRHKEISTTKGSSSNNAGDGPTVLNRNDKVIVEESCVSSPDFKGLWLLIYICFLYYLIIVQKILLFIFYPFTDVRLSSARLVSMDGDNSCLLHSICYSLRLGFTGHIHRVKLYNYLMSLNPRTVFNWTSTYTRVLEDEILESWKCSIPQYGDLMRQSHWWCGALELTLLSNYLKCNIYVYKADAENSKTYTRIAIYKTASLNPSVNIVWVNGCHYDVLEDTVEVKDTGNSYDIAKVNFSQFSVHYVLVFIHIYDFML